MWKMYSCIKNCIFLKIKMIINEQEFCWRLCCRAFYFMFPQKQAWFPSTNKFTLYSNAWHMYVKVLEIRRMYRISTWSVSHFFLSLPSSSLDGGWTLKPSVRRPSFDCILATTQKMDSFFFSFALTKCALLGWKPTFLPYTLVCVNNITY